MVQKTLVSDISKMFCLADRPSGFSNYCCKAFNIQSVPGGKVKYLGSRSIGHSKQKSVYVHISCSERFPK
jgi:hypothetical protein